MWRFSRRVSRAIGSRGASALPAAVCRERRRVDSRPGGRWTIQGLDRRDWAKEDGQFLQTAVCDDVRHTPSRTGLKRRCGAHGSVGDGVAEHMAQGYPHLQPWVHERARVNRARSRQVERTNGRGPADGAGAGSEAPLAAKPLIEVFKAVQATDGAVDHHAAVQAAALNLNGRGGRGEDGERWVLRTVAVGASQRWRLCRHRHRR